MSESSSGNIDTVMHEERLFPPSEAFASQAAIGSMDAYQALYDQAKADPITFWDQVARDELHWFQPFNTVLEWDEPFAKCWTRV